MRSIFHPPTAIVTWAGVAAGLLALSLSLRAPSFVDAPLDRDEGAYALIAQQWQRGATPYRDYFDHKPPLIYLAYRLSFAIGGEHLAAVRVVFAVADALTALACAVAVWLLRGRWAPAVLAGVAACLFLNSPLVQGEAANTETLMVLGTACCVCWVLRGTASGRARDALFAGACAGLAALAKPVALCDAAFLVVWLVIQSRHRGASLAAFGVGLVSPVCAWALYALTQGTLAASAHAVVLYNLRYAGVGAVPLWARLAALPIDYGVPLALLWAGVAGCTLTVLRAEPRGANFALGWTVAAVAGIIAGGRVYDHYYQQLVPPMAVALGVTATAVGAFARGRLARTACAAGLAVGLWPPAAATWRFTEGVSARACADWQPRLASVLRQLTGPGDVMLVWGAEPYLYFAADRRPLSRFIYKYPLLGESDTAVAARRELFAAWAMRRPAVIVVVKREETAESRQSPASEIIAPDAPFHPLLGGFEPQLDTSDFTLYVRADRGAQPWRERWERAVPKGCPQAPPQPSAHAG